MANFSDKLFAKADKWLADYKTQPKKEAEKKALAANAQGGILYSDGSFVAPSDYSEAEAKDLKRVLAQMYINDAIKENKRSVGGVKEELKGIMPDFRDIAFGEDLDGNMWYEAVWEK